MWTRLESICILVFVVGPRPDFGPLVQFHDQSLSNIISVLILCVLKSSNWSTFVLIVVGPKFHHFKPHKPLSSTHVLNK